MLFVTGDIGPMKYGLDDVVAATTRLSSVDGKAGRLVVAGYGIEELAPNASFEAVVHLLLIGRLPNPAELRRFAQELSRLREIPPIALRVLQEAAEHDVLPMDALRMVVPLLDMDSDAGTLHQALKVISSIPTIVGSYARLRNGLPPVIPNPVLSHAAHCLHQYTGAEPDAEHSRALETYLNTVCDHGFNASTFTARVIVSTGSDLVSAITGAVGALKGPLHGGAPGPALDMVLEIAEPTKAEAYLRAKLERGERLMGFGHRVYRVRDPRADVLALAISRFYQSTANQSLYELARAVETTALALLREYKPDRKLETNVEFYTALLLHGLGFSTQFFTPIFAVGRAAGWCAHCLEQIREGRLIRPQSQYVGDMNLKYQLDDEAGSVRQGSMR
jgi:citrate synthase